MKKSTVEKQEKCNKIVAIIRSTLRDLRINSGEFRPQIKREELIKIVCEHLGYKQNLKIDDILEVLSSIEAGINAAIDRGVICKTKGKIKLLLRGFEDYDWEFLHSLFLDSMSDEWNGIDDTVLTFCRYMGYPEGDEGVEDRCKNSIIPELIRQDRLELNEKSLRKNNKSTAIKT